MTYSAVKRGKGWRPSISRSKITSSLGPLVIAITALAAVIVIVTRNSTWSHRLIGPGHLRCKA